MVNNRAAVKHNQIFAVTVLLCTLRVLIKKKRWSHTIYYTPLKNALKVEHHTQTDLKYIYFKVPRLSIIHWIMLLITFEINMHIGLNYEIIVHARGIRNALRLNSIIEPTTPWMYAPKSSGLSHLFKHHYMHCGMVQLLINLNKNNL